MINNDFAATLPWFLTLLIVLVPIIMYLLIFVSILLTEKNTRNTTKTLEKLNDNIVMIGQRLDNVMLKMEVPLPNGDENLQNNNEQN